MTEGDAAGRLTRDTAELIREEVARSRAELMATLRRAGVGAALLGGAAVCGLLAVEYGAVTALRTLESVLPRPAAAVVLTVGYGAAGGALAAVGVQRLREAGIITGRAVAGVKEDVQTASGS